MSITQFKKSPDKLKSYLKNSVKPSEKEDLYSLLTDQNISNEIKFIVYQQIKKRKDLFDLEKISKALELPQTTVKKIFKSVPIKAKFPIVLGSKGEIATAYITPLDNSIDRNSFKQKSDIQEELNTIRSILKNKNFPIKNFFVIFDKDFYGKSYMLSVFAGLTLPEESLKNFAFTGILNEEGEILPVEYLREKEKISEKQNIKLITPDHINTIEELIYYIGDESLDIPFIFMIDKPKDETNLAIKKIEKLIKKRKPFFSLEKLENIFGLSRQDLIIGYKEPLPTVNFKELEILNPWTEQVILFEKKLKNIYSKFQYKKRILHLGLAVPSSLAMGLGIKLGAKKPVVVYHYQSDEYIPVADLSDHKKLRKIKYIRKEIEKELNLIKITFLKNKISSKEDTAVVIWLASHNICFDVKNYLTHEKRNYPILKIESKEHQGDIPLPVDLDKKNKDLWIRYVSEIYSTLNILKNKEKIKRYHIFLSSPVPIAFLLGMAVGHFWDGIIYNIRFNRDKKYHPVFNLNNKHLISIF